MTAAQRNATKEAVIRRLREAITDERARRQAERDMAEMEAQR